MSGDLRITPWKCPFCIGGLATADGGRCLHCSGSGLTDDPCGPAQRAPRPPAVMRAACADCAFRPGSPELEAAGASLPEDEPFFCHQGLPVSATGAYEPVATFRGLPLGAMVCAGWWAMRTGEQLPGRPYREVPITEDQVEERWGAVPYALTGQQLTPDQIAAIKASGILDQLDPGGFLTAALVNEAIDQLRQEGPTS
ncbi:hypothetical protein [Streptacidiphilus rugosus]|uniref:hypothetical protein n=1 Tax=Streptacidiphilus rugosus TaxID=405783 RepID=UPI000569C148|nr:hypothetical protein [Streptacidiphilus rugosus]